MNAHFIEDNVGCYGLSDPYAEHPVVNRHICYFGGGGGSSPMGMQTSTTKTTQELSPEQRDLLDSTVGTLKWFAKNPPKSYQGPRVAGFDPREEAAHQMALGAAFGPGQAIANQAMSTSKFLSGANLYAGSNPYLQSAINAAITPQIRAFNETVIPGTRTDATNSGQFGGTRQGIAEGIAGRGLIDSIGNTAATMSNANYQKGQDSLVSALQLAPLIQQMQFVPASVVGDIGYQGRQLAQQNIDANIQQDMMNQLLPYLAAKDVAGVAFGFPGGGTTSTSTAPYQAPYQQNTGMQNALGIGSLGLGLLSTGAMFM